MWKIITIAVLSCATIISLLSHVEPYFDSRNYDFALHKMLIVNQWNNCAIDKSDITGNLPIRHHTGIW